MLSGVGLGNMAMKILGQSALVGLNSAIDTYVS